MTIDSAISRVNAIQAQIAALQTPATAPARNGFAASLDHELAGGVPPSLLSPTSSAADGGAPTLSPSALSLIANLLPAGGSASTSDVERRSLLQAATRWLGTAYSWGGGGPAGPSLGTAQGAATVGFDCSSLMQYAFASSGVTIPRTSQEQFRAGTPVAAADLKPGDLVFFDGTPPGHVGMYLGNGQFVHASR